MTNDSIPTVAANAASAAPAAGSDAAAASAAVEKKPSAAPSRGLKGLVLGLAGLVLLATVAWLGWSKLGGSNAKPVVAAIDEEQGEDPAIEAPVTSWTLAPAKIDPAAVLGAEQLAGVAKVVVQHAAKFDTPELDRAMRLAGQAGKPAASDAAGEQHRWELQFPKKNSLDTYARQLDFFGIELGVVGPKNNLVYASGLSKPKPDVRTGPASDEKRYYLTWRRGDLGEADHQFYARAGLDTRGRIVLRFLPEEIEKMLADLERAHAEDKADRIERTRFGIRAHGAAYEFYVVEQTYLAKKPGRP